MYFIKYKTLIKIIVSEVEGCRKSWKK